MNPHAERVEFEDAGGVDWEQEAADLSAAPAASALTDIAAMAAKLQALDQEVESAEEALKALKAARDKVAKVDLPEALEGAGLQELKLANGRKLGVKETLYAEMPKDRVKRNEAASWMERHNHAALIKTEVTIQFDRGDGDLAKDTAELLKARGLTPVVAETMNTASVKAAINEMREQGVEVPLNLFGAWLEKRAYIK